MIHSYHANAYNTMYVSQQPALTKQITVIFLAINLLVQKECFIEGHLPLNAAHTIVETHFTH